MNYSPALAWAFSGSLYMGDLFVVSITRYFNNLRIAGETAFGINLNLSKEIIVVLTFAC